MAQEVPRSGAAPLDLRAPVTVAVLFQDGTVGTLTGRGFLHAGFG